MAAGAVVTPGKTVASGEVWAGSPAKMLRQLEPEEAGFIAQAGQNLSLEHFADECASRGLKIGALKTYTFNPNSQTPQP